MTKPREKTREELRAEIEDGKKKIQQFENREKMLRQKLSKEKRRTRSHHLIVRGAVFESIVPEAKTMTDEEAAALLLSVAQKHPPEHRRGHHRLYAPDPLCVCVTKTKNTKMTAPEMEIGRASCRERV